MSPSDSGTIRVSLPLSDICLLTEDLDQSVAFWRHTAGLIPKQHNDHFADFDTGAATLALWDKSHFSRATGIDHASVMVAIKYDTRSEVTTAYATLHARGTEFTAPPKRYDWGAFACYFLDPDGAVIELYTWETPAEEDA
ncbi:MAG: VOC family protein [Pseudomonadota bacterium]